jgi:TrpR-related protein YerC/YecD
MKTHRNVTPRQEALAERNLCAAVASLRTPDECRAFFRDLCTPAELQAMADRWAVVDFLKRGLPYREIHRITGVSVTTIGRVARFLAAGNGGYEVAARRLEEARREQAGPRSGGDSAESPTQSGKRAAAPRRIEASRHG